MPQFGFQAEYNLIERTAERDIFPMARALGRVVLAWGPLAGGVLSGKYVLNANTMPIEDSLRGAWLNSERITRDALHIAALVVRIAEELSCPPAAVALTGCDSSRLASSQLLRAERCFN